MRPHPAYRHGRGELGDLRRRNAQGIADGAHGAVGGTALPVLQVDQRLGGDVRRGQLADAHQLLDAPRA
jgi:hypothetical protein